MQHKGSFIEIGHRHLSRYRAHFEKLTRAVVEHHVANRLSREDEKRFAGLAWLNELDEIKKQQEARQDRISAQRWGGVGIVIAVIGIMVAAYNAFKPPALPPAPLINTLCPD